MPLNGRVHRSDDAVEFGIVERLEEKFAVKVQRIFGPDAEVMSDEAFVASQTVSKEFFGTRRWSRKHVRLVAQRSLPQEEPHRHRVLGFSSQTHEPSVRLVDGSSRGEHTRPLTAHTRAPFIDSSLEHRARRVVEQIGHRRITNT